MTRKMADAVNPNNIPVGVYPLVAGYINGPISQWPASGWARHAGRSILVRITVFASTNDGHVLDVEKGDATPAQAPPWVKMRRAAGADPTVYCSEAAWPAVRQAFAAAKVPEPHYWVAAYPGEGQVIPAGAIAHQWIDRGPLDESVVADYWPGVDQGGTVELTDAVYTRAANVAAPGPRTLGQILQFIDQWILDGGPNGPNGQSANTVLGALADNVTAIQSDLGKPAPSPVAGTYSVGPITLTGPIPAVATLMPGAAPLPQVVTTTHTISASAPTTDSPTA